MTRISPTALSRLADILDVTINLSAIVQERSLEDFMSDQEFRWSVERALETLVNREVRHVGMLQSWKITYPICRTGCRSTISSPINTTVWTCRSPGRS